MNDNRFLDIAGYVFSIVSGTPGWEIFSEGIGVESVRTPWSYAVTIGEKIAK